MDTLKFLILNQKKALNSGRRGEAEIENSPVECFPAEPTEQVLCTCETLNPAGLGLPQEAKKGRIAICYPSFSNSCGRWDLNPHDIAITRSLVLLVYQFRHFRATMLYYHFEYGLSTHFYIFSNNISSSVAGSHFL